MRINSEEKRLLLDLISKEQINMIKSNHSKYKSNKYKILEQLKAKIDETRR